jgi:two-component system invasion response regulator UvrY
MSEDLRPGPVTRWEADGRPVCVILADGHALMRSSLRRLLDGEHDIEVIAEASDFLSTVHCVHEHQPCVLVLDLRLFGGSSLETVGRLLDSAPDTQIVLTTMESSPTFARRAFAVGVAGFVAKELADGELIEAVRTVARGGRYASPQVAYALSAPRFTAARRP